MRFLFALMSLGILTQCQPIPAPSQPAAIPTARADVPSEVDTQPTEPPSPTSSPAYTHKILNGITFQGVSFDSRSHQLVVMDQANGPGSRYANASAAGQAADGIAAINGGFFTPEGKPLGLVISRGESAGYWNSASSLGSAVWHRPKNGSPRITRRDTLGFPRAKGMQELLQAGPLLIENSTTVSGLNTTNLRDRSIMLWDGQHQWWIGTTSPCSLDQLAKCLAQQSPTIWSVKIALNLDGGSSCDLWISDEIAEKSISTHSFFSRKARNYLVLQPK